MGIWLREAGIDSFEIFEKASAVGGTWRDNRYPGVACDVPAQYYCYPFAPNTNSDTIFAPGPRLWDYLEDMTTRFDLRRHLRLDTDIELAEWTGRDWILTTTSGETHRADIVVGAVGRLRVPRFPDIAGLSGFGGRVVHAAQWDESLQLEGKRVGLIGTGSSAVQILSALVDIVDHIDVFQRTPQWVFPWKNTDIDPEILAETRQSEEAAIRLYSEAGARFRFLSEGIITGGSAQERNAACMAALDTVKNPVLKAKLTPDYEVGCKRMVVSGTFYDDVQKPNVSLVTEGIVRVEADGVRMKDGALRPLDVIVLATGYHADSYLRPMQVKGEDG